MIQADNYSLFGLVYTCSLPYSYFELLIIVTFRLPKESSHIVKQIPIISFDGHLKPSELFQPSDIRSGLFFEAVASALVYNKL